MKSAEECLAAALELEKSAANASSDKNREILLRVAAQWRKLAADAVAVRRITSRKTE